jgi:hypothetical protein
VPVRCAWSPNGLADPLIEAPRRGVTCPLLLDAIASRPVLRTFAPFQVVCPRRSDTPCQPFAPFAVIDQGLPERDALRHNTLFAESHKSLQEKYLQI